MSEVDAIFGTEDPSTKKEEENPWADEKKEEEDESSSYPEEDEEIEEEEEEDDEEESKDDTKEELKEEDIGSEVGKVDIKITESEKIGDGMNAYVTYTIRTKTDTQVFGTDKDMTAIRRYSDFIWLHSALKSAHKTVLIPPLPEKGLINRFSPEFIEYRRKELQRFLNRVVVHPKLVQTPELKTFLQSTRELDKTAVTKKGGEKKEKKGWFAALTERVSSVQNQVQANLTSVEEVDEWFMEVKQYVEKLEAQLQGVYSRTSSLTKKHKELVQLWSEFSQVSGEYSKTEEDKDKVLHPLFDKLSEVTAQISQLADETCNDEINGFEDPVKDYIRVTGAVKDLLANRDKALFSLQSADKSLKAKQAKAAANTSSGKAASLQKDVNEASAEKDKAKAKFDRMSTEIKAEIEKFLQTKNKDMTASIRRLVQANMNHELRVLDLWKELLSLIEEENV